MTDSETDGQFLMRTFNGRVVFLQRDDRELIAPPDWVRWPRVRLDQMGSDAWKAGPPPLIGPIEDIKPKKRLKTRGYGDAAAK